MRVTSPVRIAFGVAVVAVLAFTACSELPTSPTPRNSLSPDATGPLFGKNKKEKKGKLAEPVLVDALLWKKPVSHRSVHKVIGPKGGTIDLKGGTKIIFPEGALSADVEITATRLAGKIVAFEFEPHGIQFDRPVIVDLPTKNTIVPDLQSLEDIRAAYFPHVSALNPGHGTAIVTEFEPTFVSADKSHIRFSVDHFSGYLVSMGRKGGDSGR